MINVYQWHLNKSDKDLLERDGWSASEKIYAYGGKGLAGTDLYKWFDEYKKVAVVDSNDFEETFRLMNLWNQKSRVLKLDRECASLSVGDVLEMDGKFFLVDKFGYKKFDKNCSVSQLA
tara:strand:- start:885 stop:1241 length:357 start_codon:yes stop_codon:yes gene_type:complete